jgi:hypothetical protein
MIAIFLGMLVLSTGYTVFQSSNRATREQNAGNRMYDNARVAMDVMVRSFRRAGFLVNFMAYKRQPNGLNWPVNGITHKLVTGNTTSAPDSVTIVGGTLSELGYLQRSVDRGTSTLILTAGSDMTSIKKDSVIGVGLTYSGVVAQDPDLGTRTVTLDASVPTGALNMYFPGNKLQDGVTDSNQIAAPVRLLTSTRYYIDTSDAAHPVLMQQEQGTPEPIAEDIEDLQIAYGVDSNNNRIIENNEWVNSVTTDGDIDRIRLVRITIVARTSQRDPALRNVAQTVPALEDRPARANLTDGYRRFILTRIVKTGNLDAINTL